MFKLEKCAQKKQRKRRGFTVSMSVITGVKFVDRESVLKTW